MFAAEIDDAAVDFDHGDAVNRVLENFLEGAAVAAADEQHPLRAAVRHEGNVGQHFVVEKFVGLGRLNDSVQRQHPAQHPVLEDQDRLESGLSLVQDAVDLDGLVNSVVQPFAEFPQPVTPRFNSVTRVFTDAKWRCMTGTIRRASQSPQTKMSRAANPSSGQVWMDI